MSITIANITFDNVDYDAGADVLYPPGVSTPADVEAVVKAVAPKPVNILIIRPDMSANELEGLGVRRMSIGGFPPRSPSKRPPTDLKETAPSRRKSSVELVRESEDQ